MERRNYYYVEWQGPQREEFDPVLLLLRFIINIPAMWVAQWLVTGFDIDSWGALLLGAAIFGAINALIKPIVSLVAWPCACLTLGLFTLVINAVMLALTAWIAGLFDVAFEVDGFIAAFLGALVISVVSAPLSWWGRRIIYPRSEPY